MKGTFAHLGGECGRVRGVLEEAALGSVGEIPGRALQRIKVIEPVLIELVASLAHIPMQPVVQNLRWHCKHKWNVYQHLIRAAQSTSGVLTGDKQQPVSPSLLIWNKISDAGNKSCAIAP